MADFLQELLNPYNLQIVMLMVINSLLALSVWVPLSAGQLSLGGAGFMSIGAYTAALLSLEAGWAIVPSIVAAAFVATVAAYLLGYPTLRLQGVYLAIATLSFGEMVRILALNLEMTNGALGLAGIPQMVDSVAWYMMDHTPWADGTWFFDTYTIASIVVLTLLFFVLLASLYALTVQARARVGRALKAIRLDELAAQAMGIDTTRYKLLVFAQSGFFAGLAGGIYAHLYYFIGPSDFGFNRAIEMLLYVVLGGMETVWGILLGAGALTLLPETLRFSASFRSMLYGIILLLMMVFRPQGLLTRDMVETLRDRWRRRTPSVRKGGVA